MPQRKCAAKRLRVDKTKNYCNTKIKSDLKKEIKKFLAVLKQGKADEAKKNIKLVFAKLDRAASKGLIHKNTAARRKSSLALKLNKLT